MKIVLASILALTLGACAVLAPSSGLTSSQQLLAAQQARNTACGLWSGVFSTALAMREAKTASPTLIQQISLADSQLTPVCTAPLPTSLATIQAQTTQVMTSVGVLEYLTRSKP